ncbi:MAG TPA: ADYC domain-containing protein [Kofleriaceae bacterium]|nr:ADYC domain-containing protein [Kofleriaceae bacterium]
MSHPVHIGVYLPMRYLLFVSLVAACATDTEEPTIETVYAPNWEKCPDWGCGLNSPNIKGNYFHELDLSGEANLEGWTVGSARKAGVAYNIEVVQGRLKARIRTLTPSASSAFVGSTLVPTVLAGNLLVGLEISLHRNGEAYDLTITDVERVADYWARPIHPTYAGDDPPRIESYRFSVTQVGSMWGAVLCGGDTGEVASDRIPNGHAVLFEGERIHASTKTVRDTSSSWINIGCAGTALAKMHLTGHTEASQGVGFSTTIGERQTMLKMLVGDYCGDGKPFTVQGQKLMWSDDRGTIDMPSYPRSELEAHWTPGGAECLQTPRVAKNPSAQGAAKFPGGVVAAIIKECGALPWRCPTVQPSYHLSSYNPVEQ